MPAGLGQHRRAGVGRGRRVDFDRAARTGTWRSAAVRTAASGSHLARMELRVTLEEWHRVIPAYRVARGVELNYSRAFARSTTSSSCGNSGRSAPTSEHEIDSQPEGIPVVNIDVPNIDERERSGATVLRRIYLGVALENSTNRSATTSRQRTSSSRICPSSTRITISWGRRDNCISPTTTAAMTGRPRTGVPDHRDGVECMTYPFLSDGDVALRPVGDPEFVVRTAPAGRPW